MAEVLCAPVLFSLETALVILQGNAAKQTVRLAFEKIRSLQLDLEGKMEV